MRILNVSFKVISDSILESFALDLAALGAKVSLALFLGLGGAGSSEGDESPTC